MFFLIGASALLGLIIAMVIILISAMIVLGVMMAWYLTKGNNAQKEIVSDDVAVIESRQARESKEVNQPKESKQVKEPKEARQPKEPKQSKEFKEPEKDSKINNETVPYGSKPAYGVSNYGSGSTAQAANSNNDHAANSNNDYGSTQSSGYGSQSSGYGSAPYGSGNSNYGSQSGGYGSAPYGSEPKKDDYTHSTTSSLHVSPSQNADGDDSPYGTKKPAKLANVEIELPKSDWGTKPLFERVAGLPSAQKTIYERARYLLKSRLTNYTTDICEVYFNGESPAARLIVYKGQILVFISVDMADVSKEKFHVKNVSNLSVSNGLPTLLLIRTMDQANGIERLLDKLIAG